ncbi:MAG: hypothetical protein M1822_000881 [Bathelium mastoideum]|nr:MAG: hypothetical protein M1822_000881 [Bathelium mastoideum]
MSAQIQPIKVWGRGGPNPPKIGILVRELDIPHEIINYPISDVKKPEYLAINPNGRLPAIQDPNTGLTLWESGAIVEYLVEQYDTQHKLSFAPGTTESYLAKQWLFFQTTGQAPYFGQAVWFKKYHPETVTSAQERYINEVKRVNGVLDKYLAQQKQEHGSSTDSNGPWLVGNKMSYADLAFVPWAKVIEVILDKSEYNVEEFPHVKDWLDRMTSREHVKNVLALAFQR